MIGSHHFILALEPVFNDIIIAWMIGQKLMIAISRVAGARKIHPAACCFEVILIPFFFIFDSVLPVASKETLSLLDKNGESDHRFPVFQFSSNLAVMLIH